MCGITGILQTGKSNYDLTDVIIKMSHEIRHRGPDDEGYLFWDGKRTAIYGGDTTNFADRSITYNPDTHIRNSNNTQAKLALAHRRLSILDLSTAGHQPMPDKTGRYWIIYNGEIYNYNELKQVLQKKGYQFRTTTDTEVVLYSLIQWGEEALHKFNGMFAIAFADFQKNKLFIARDRLGIKPVFYYRTKDVFLFGSNVRSIVASGLYQKDINWEGLWYNFAYGFSIKPLTVFKDIYMLEPGASLEIDLQTGSMRKKIWWQIQPAGEKINDEDNAKKKLDELLHQSIKYRLIADVEVATFLSGGIDSGLVTTIADKYHSGIKAFTMTFPNDDRYNDELERAKLTAQANNLNQIISEIDTSDFMKFFDDIIYSYEEPFPQMGQVFLLAQAVKRENIKIVQMGLGADEILGGYGWYSSIKKWKLLRHIQFINKFIPSDKPKIKKLKQSRRARNWPEIYGLMYTKYPDKILEKLFPEEYKYDSLAAISKILNPGNIKFTNPVDTFNFFDIKLFLGSNTLYHSDQFFMENSIEGRVPFLDHNLVNFSFSLSPELKVKGLLKPETKYILKKLSENYLPYEIIYKKKLGFNLPVRVWSQDKLKGFIQETINNLKALNLLNPGQIDNIMQDNIPWQKWHLVMFYHWYIRFFTP